MATLFFHLDSLFSLRIISAQNRGIQSYAPSSTLQLYGLSTFSVFSFQYARQAGQVIQVDGRALSHRLR